jgi:hypothetical protein
MIRMKLKVILMMAQILFWEGLGRFGHSKRKKLGYY